MTIKILLIAMRSNPKNIGLETVLMDMLKHQGSDAVELLQENNSENKLVSQDVKNLFLVLQKCPFIKKLKLDNILSDRAAIVTLLQNCLANTSLTEIKIYDHQIRFEGIGILLGQLIEHNAKLTTLDLQGNGIATDEMKLIAQALKLNKSLESVDLRGNFLDTEGLIGLGRVLEVHPTLKSLRVSGLNIKNNSILALIHIVSNKTRLINPDVLLIEPAICQNPNLRASAGVLTSLDSAYQNMRHRAIHHLFDFLKKPAVVDRISLYDTGILQCPPILVRRTSSDTSIRRSVHSVPQTPVNNKFIRNKNKCTLS